MYGKATLIYCAKILVNAWNKFWKDPVSTLKYVFFICKKFINSIIIFYIKVHPAILALIGRDVENLGRCRFTVAKETYHTFHSGYQLTKGSPFTKMFNQECVFIEQMCIYV